MYLPTPPIITLLESLLIEPLENSTEADLDVEFWGLLFNSGNKCL